MILNIDCVMHKDGIMNKYVSAGIKFGIGVATAAGTWALISKDGPAQGYERILPNVVLATGAGVAYAGLRKNQATEKNQEYGFRRYVCDFSKAAVVAALAGECWEATSTTSAQELLSELYDSQTSFPGQASAVEAVVEAGIATGVGSGVEGIDNLLKMFSNENNRD